jgi:hypothetical protein
MKKIFQLLISMDGRVLARNVPDNVEIAQEAVSLDEPSKGNCGMGIDNDVSTIATCSPNLMKYKDPVPTYIYPSLLLSPHYTDLDPAECDTANGQHLMQNAPQPLSASMPEDKFSIGSVLGLRSTVRIQYSNMTTKRTR